MGACWQSCQACGGSGLAETIKHLTARTRIASCRRDTMAPTGWGVREVAVTIVVVWAAITAALAD